MQWFLVGGVSLCSEGLYHQAHRRMNLSLFMFLTRVCTSFCHFIWTAPNSENTELLDYPESNPDAATHGASPFQKATPEEQEDPTSQPSRLPWRPTHERQLSETLVAKTERDRRIAQLTDELALKSALLEQAQANEAKVEERAGLELRELQAKLDESLLSHDLALQQAEANAAEDKKRALRELQTKLDESLLSRDLVLQQAEANAAEERKRAGLELRELQAKLEYDELLPSRDHALEQAEANADEKKRAGLELRELQAKLDESRLSRDHALEQAQSALQKASCAAEANEQSLRELTEMRAELEASKSESAAFRLRLANMENGCVESNAEADIYRTQTATGIANTDEDRAVHRLMGRIQAMEAKMASSGWNEKSFELIECRNEG